MATLLTGLQCLNTFADSVQRRILENMNDWAGPETTIKWLLDADYEDPREFLGTCVNFLYNGEEGQKYWEAVYDQL